MRIGPREGRLDRKRIACDIFSHRVKIDCSARNSSPRVRGYDDFRERSRINDDSGRTTNATDTGRHFICVGSSHGCIGCCKYASRINGSYRDVRIGPGKRWLNGQRDMTRIFCHSTKTNITRRHCCSWIWSNHNKSRDLLHSYRHVTGR